MEQVELMRRNVAFCPKMALSQLHVKPVPQPNASKSAWSAEKAFSLAPGPAVNVVTWLRDKLKEAALQKFGMPPAYYSDGTQTRSSLHTSSSCKYASYVVLVKNSPTIWHDPLMSILHGHSSWC